MKDNPLDLFKVLVARVPRRVTVQESKDKQTDEKENRYINDNLQCEH